MRTATSRHSLDAVHGLHEAESLEDLGEAFRRGVAPLVPGDLHEIFVFGTGDAGNDLWLGSPGGYSAPERAELLAYLDAMSKPTVSTHVGRILHKLGADNRLTAALTVIRRVLAES